MRNCKQSNNHNKSKYLMDHKTELKQFLDNSMDKFNSLVMNITEDQLESRIQDKEGGWTVIEILRHIQNSEKGLLLQINNILSGGEGAPADFDLAKYNKRSNEKMNEMTFEEVKIKMIENRTATLKILESITDEQLELRGRHANLKEYSILDFFKTISYHQHSHVKKIIEELGIS